MSGWLFRLEIDLGDGAIHDEEAATAILTRIFRSWRNGNTTRLQKLVQDTLLDLPSEPGKWSEEQWQCAREICATDKEFQERFGRALAQGRKPMFDKVDLFILRNWRVIHDIKGITHLPGLWYWHPAAAGALLAEYDDTLSGSEEWFVQRRKRLGIKFKTPYRVKSLLRNRYGKIVADLD